MSLDVQPASVFFFSLFFCWFEGIATLVHFFKANMANLHGDSAISGDTPKGEVPEPMHREDIESNRARGHFLQPRSLLPCMIGQGQFATSLQSRKITIAVVNIAKAKYTRSANACP